MQYKVVYHGGVYHGDVYHGDVYILVTAGNRPDCVYCLYILAMKFPFSIVLDKIIMVIRLAPVRIDGELAYRRERICLIMLCYCGYTPFPSVISDGLVG